MKMNGTTLGAAWLAMGLVAGAPVVSGQTSAAFNFNPIAPVRGVQLTGVSVYSGYFSAGAPTGFAAPVQSPFLRGPSAMGGAAATFGGARTGEISSFAWSYSPSYFNLFYADHEIDNHGSLNHRMDVSWRRRLGAKWSLSTSLNGFIANLEQLYFNPSALSDVAAIPTTFDDLAAAMLAGKFTDAQLASLLTGAPLPSTAEQGYLYGTRILSAGANVGLSWAHSERTSVSVTLSGNRVQHLNGVGTSGDSPGGGVHLPQMTSATATVGWSYSLSPRTQFGANASSTRTFSSLQQGYATHAGVSVGRTMSTRWYVQGRAGIGKFLYSHQLYAAPKAVQYTYGGSLGFKTYTQTFLAAYDRSLGDTYGLGSGTTSSLRGAWAWSRPGASWGVSAYVGFQELHNPSFQNTRSWRAGAGCGRRLRAHFSVAANYVYAQIPVDLRTAGSDLTQNGVSVSLTWSPGGYQ
jgi:hypothetical protein